MVAPFADKINVVKLQIGVKSIVGRMEFTFSQKILLCKLYPIFTIQKTIKKIEIKITQEAS